ncbi:hypothetical protein LguiA_025722 [Lonicera macranthoides]
MWKLTTSKGEEEPWIKSLNKNVGRQFWEFDPNLGTPQQLSQIQFFREEFHKNRFQSKHSSDLLMRYQFERENGCEMKIESKEEEEKEEEMNSVEIVKRRLRKALVFYSSIQAEDGHWPGDYGGPLFLLPGLVIGLYIMGALGTIFPEEHQREIRRYLYNHQNEDGGWGLHIEGRSVMFGTCLNYVTLRLLGEEMDGGDGAMTKARKWILDHGGATHVPSWGKLWLSVLGVYDWSGNNPLLPEMWLLPDFLPIHPGRMWCHCRMVYLPMSYLYGKRFVGPTNSTVLSLRKELYTLPYHQIDWDTSRNQCAKEDLYYPHPLVQDILWAGLHKVAEPLLMRWPFSKLRNKALTTVIQHIHYEDDNTNYICIGPVNKVLNMLCCWVEDPRSMRNKLHLSRIKDYMWVAEDGMKMQGYNGSQLWDTTLAVQAILATKMSDEYSSTLKKAHDFIKISQVRENSTGNFGKWYRHISKGGWPFSTRDNGWPVSDCTAEGLKTAMLLQQMPSHIVGEAITADQSYDAINFILSLQNSNGGFPSYEPTRSYAWLEVINPAETFGDIIIDYQYVECSSAVIQGLRLFLERYPNYRKKEIEASISKALDFIESIQLADGSWYGSWGVCYTYGTWFGIKGLIAGGKNYQNSPTIRRACDFLLSKQLDNGGWGESYHSCQDKVYSQIEGNKSHVANTAWAMMALIEAGQEIIGVFNRNCMISYSAYRNIFPIWALGEYLNHVLLLPTSFNV